VKLPLWFDGHRLATGLVNHGGALDYRGAGPADESGGPGLGFCFAIGPAGGLGEGNAERHNAPPGMVV